MSTTTFKYNGVTCLKSIDSEDDLKMKPGINICPPPADGRCDCCGKHISELNPFSKMGDFNGELLVSVSRRMGPYDEEAEAAMDEAMRCYERDGFDNPLDWMINKYGKDKGESLCFAAEMYGSFESRWLCRDCIGLGEDEYLEKSQETYRRRKSVQNDSSRN